MCVCVCVCKIVYVAGRHVAILTNGRVVMHCSEVVGLH